MVTDRSVRVVLADDHTRLRGTVRDALTASGCEVVGEGATADEALALALEHRPDVALLDIHMPGGGIRAAREIARTLPGTTVVMLTASEADDDLFDSLRAGAQGYLLKDGDPTLLGDALRGVLEGRAAIAPLLLTRIIGEFQAPGRRRFRPRSRAADRLSDREWQVMELLAEGLTTEAVAGRLFVSPTTVRVHVSAVLRKLRVKDRAGAFDALRRA